MNKSHIVNEHYVLNTCKLIKTKILQVGIKSTNDHLVYHVISV